ncbi:hypothetical protein CLV59_105193 [Chitinophaga dinghuensis]|uniref:SMODS and SLOG-associating 2TM effector domain-containing protein n=1 Tax=Chitinophaga dinghuensis TaxID=1539050 RepID=A0A327VYR3_9BACT|nr:hypothetical protein [Chitinophaga dinghuensis]RAJ80086.1 hypothetical protein CLV59_105193 [Chitinophaga dinghuensis]
MSNINSDILSELRRIVLNCTDKRTLLLYNALQKARIRKTLSILSGILALFSAGTITSVIIKYLGDEILQIIAALTAALSGTLSLTLAIYFDEENISKSFEGASKYLSLRDRAYRSLINPNNSNTELYDVLANLHSDYAELDERFSKYTRYKRRRSKEVPFSSEPDLMVGILNTYDGLRYRKIAKALFNEERNLNDLINRLNREHNSSSD